MSELNVDPSLLLARSGQFRKAGSEQAQAGALDDSQTESDIAAFGEINAALHDSWRQVRALQARSWSGLGREHDEHGDNLTTAARGYEGTDVVNNQMLRYDGE
ncbi:type VII secretion target [Mycolicibacterium lutetiense]